MPTHRRTQWALVALSFGSGATDAFAFLALGGVFTANMTGNLVLVGLVGRADYVATLVAAMIALVAFVLALFVAFRVSRPVDPVRGRHRVPMLLVAIIAIQSLVTVLWWAADDRIGLPRQYLLIALSAAAMAFHTVIGRRVSVNAGLSTTFVTGTLVAVVQDLSEGRWTHQALRLTSIAALVLGSLAAAVLLLWQAGLGPVLPVIAAGGALLLLSTGGRPYPRAPGLPPSTPPSGV